MIKGLISMLDKNPEKIFILDGLGAIFTAFSLGVILVHLEGIFGIPKQTLQILAVIPLVYLIYDIICYFFVKAENISFWLKVIALLNLTFCPISIGFAVKEYEVIKTLGWIYIVIEIIGVIIISFYELKFAKELQRKNKARH